MNDKENQGLTFHISPNQTFLCDINIDSISKDENYLLIKIGNTIKRLKISDIRQAIRLVTETNKHDTKDITGTMEVAEKDMKNKTYIMGNYMIRMNDKGILRITSDKGVILVQPKADNSIEIKYN